jgi:hypothetical protein
MLTYGNSLNIFNIHQARSDKGEILSMAQNLAERNDLPKDLPLKPANQGLTEKGFRWTTLPSGKRVQIGGYWGSSTAQGENFIEGMFQVKDSYEPHLDVLTDDDPEAAARRVDGDIAAFEEGLYQSWANLMVKGDATPRQDSIVGLMQRAPYTAIDNEFCFNVGGAGVAANQNLRSAWLVAPGFNTFYGIYNKAHPTLGIEKKRMPVQRIPDPDDATQHAYISPVEFMFSQGICIRDQKAVKRLANIPCGYGDVVTGQWFEALMYARYMHSVVADFETMAGAKGTQWFLYVDGWLYAKLLATINNEKSQVYMGDGNLYHTKLLMIGDIVVRRLDALGYAKDAGETYVA